MRRRLGGIAFLVVAGVALAAPPDLTAQAATPTDEAYRQLNTALVENHIVPRYDRLAAAARTLDETAVAFCAAPDAQGLAALRAAFGSGLEAWMGIQHVQFGPIAQDDRAFRLHFWPERRNAVGRHLSVLLAGRSVPDLMPERFAKASVAVQGFPALERLLFDPGATALVGDDESGSFHCAVAIAITNNIRSIADAVLVEWRGNDGWGQRRASGEADGGAAQATRQLLNSLKSGLQLVHFLKLRRPLGETLEDARPRQAETRRSGRALANVQANLRSLRAVYGGDGGRGFDAMLREDIGDTELADLLANAFDEVVRVAEKIEPPLTDAVADPARRPAVADLRLKVEALDKLVATRLAKAVGLTVGFNSLDGD